MRYINNLQGFLLLQKKHVSLPERSTKILLPYLFVCVCHLQTPFSQKQCFLFGRFSSKHPLFVGPEHVELLGGSTLGSCEKTAASKYLHPCGRILTQYHVFFWHSHISWKKMYTKNCRTISSNCPNCYLIVLMRHAKIGLQTKWTRRLSNGRRWHTCYAMFCFPSAISHSKDQVTATQAAGGKNAP